MATVTMTTLCLLAVLAVLVPLLQAKVIFNPRGFVKLPDAKNAFTFNAGTATKAAYDSVANMLYVIGHRADVLHVLDMRDSLVNPVLARTIEFNLINQGLPNDVKVCRGGMSRDFVAVSFESKDLTERGHVHFYQLLNDPSDAFIRIKTVTTVEGFDPKSMAWNSLCTELVVTSQGAVHTINGRFEDPKPAVDILIPSFGLNIDRRSMPFSEAAIKSAGVREVFTQCDSGSHDTLSSHAQDLEPVHVTVGDDNVAYMLFQTNNAIGRMDLKNPLSPMTYHNLGMKDWSQYTIDTSSTDGIKHYPHHIKSLYQPGHAVTFTLGNKTYLATADGGSIKQYAVRSGSATLCNFDESSVGRSWKNAFSSAIDASIASQLTANLSTSTSNMRFSRLKTYTDGYNPLQQGYNHLLTYGGRGWSLIDTSDMSRVYDSGDVMETYYTSGDVKDPQKAVYNDYYSSYNTAQTANKDKTSPLFGPNPTAIATGNINGTQVVAVANGYVGGLYVFSVLNDTAPKVTFEGFGRRGSPGMTWLDSYKQAADEVGEPGISDLIWIQDEGQDVVVAVSSIAGAVSVYSVELQ